MPKSQNKKIADLKKSEVKAIRRRYAKGLASQRELAEEYGLGAHQVGRITRGEARAEDGGPIELRGRSKLTKRQVAALRKRYAQGAASQATLAREYQVSAAAVSRLVRGHTYEDVGGPRTESGGMPHGRKLTPKQILDVARSDENMSALPASTASPARLSRRCASAGRSGSPRRARAARGSSTEARPADVPKAAASISLSGVLAGSVALRHHPSHVQRHSTF